MPALTHIKLTSISSLIRYWISQVVNQETVTWIDKKRKEIKSSETGKELFTAFSMVSRYVAKNQLKLTSEDLKAASVLHPGCFPAHWSVDQAARTLLLLALPQDNPEQYFHTLNQLFTAADIGELIAIYQALPLLAYPEKLQKQAAEGVRSNMTAVFNAVALRNPYPAQYFDNLAWNQMVLKALFVGSPLDLIHGLDVRANRELARMLTDYAHERQSANRSVSPDVWQLMKICQERRN